MTHGRFRRGWLPCWFAITRRRDGDISPGKVCCALRSCASIVGARSQGIVAAAIPVSSILSLSRAIWHALSPQAVRNPERADCVRVPPARDEPPFRSCPPRNTLPPQCGDAQPACDGGLRACDDRLLSLTSSSPLPLERLKRTARKHPENHPFPKLQSMLTAH